MSRQSEYKKKFDPELGRYTRQHVYGEGVMDVFKSVGSKLFGETVKSAAKKGVEKGLTTAATKTGDYIGKKAGDKIVKLLQKEPSKKKDGDKLAKLLQKDYKPPSKSKSKNNQHEINAKVNAILSGGKII